MHILFLTTRIPFPPIGGERLRPFYFIKYLSLKHRITLLSFIEDKKETEKSKDYLSDSLEIKTVYLPKLNSYLNCVGGLLMPYPLQVSYYKSYLMYKLIREQIMREDIDLVFCHLIRMADYLKHIKIKKILDLSDALSLRYRLSSKYRKGVFKFIDYLEYKRLKSYEPKISSYFSLNLVASEIDSRYFKSMGIKNIYCLPNGVEIEEDFKEIKSKQSKIIFFANLRAYPNQDAVIYFYREIFPFIKKELKDVKLMVVGAQIPNYIYSLFKEDNSVELYPDVADIKTYIRQATVSVAPMRIGVGIQNKILQSMALKVPVVATTLAKGAIEAEDNKEIIIADKPEGFAKGVIILLKDKDLRDYIAENAFRLVKEKYLWANIVKDLERICLNLIS
jgi:sugar transferase (PEP-CTERM/EpsH1 system associated)